MDITPSSSLIAALARFTEQNNIKTGDAPAESAGTQAPKGGAPDPESRGAAVDISAGTLAAASRVSTNIVAVQPTESVSTPPPTTAAPEPKENLFHREAPTARSDQRHVLPGSVLDIKV